MSKKSGPLPERPQPPRAEKILHDVENAKLDDVIFSLPVNDPFDDNGSVASTPEEETHSLPSLKRTDSAPIPKSNPTQIRRTDSAPLQRTDSEGSSASKQSHNEETEVEMAYQKSLEFIQLSEQLKSAPNKLQAQREHLETLSEELNKSILELKHQASKLIH